MISQLGEEPNAIRITTKVSIFSFNTNPQTQMQKSRNNTNTKRINVLRMDSPIAQCVPILQKTKQDCFSLYLCKNREKKDPFSHQEKSATLTQKATPNAETLS